MEVSRPGLVEYEKPQNLSDIPEATCYKAGHLTAKNAGWRNVRPVVDIEKCVGCYRCYMYCPDGTILKKDGKIDFDYDFCKGCGICAKACKVNAISMRDEN